MNNNFIKFKYSFLTFTFHYLSDNKVLPLIIIAEMILF